MSGAAIAVIVVIVILAIILFSSIKIAREYERGVVFRLGRLLGVKGPGLYLLIPFIDKAVSVDLRTITLNVPPQEVITRDNVTVKVNAVAYFRVIEAEKAIVQVENFLVATSQTAPWGAKVSVVEVMDIELPQAMQRALARQAEAERERRAKIIAAEGELQAAEKLTQAAEVIAREPAALQLRYLQTMNEISSERTSTMIIPLPIDLFEPFIKRNRDRGPAPIAPPAQPAPARPADDVPPQAPPQQ